MANPIEWVKSHPYITGGIVLGALVLVMMTGGSSDSSGGTVTYGSTDVASATELQLAQLAAQSTTSQYAMQLSASQDYNASQVAMTAMGADVAKYTADLAAAVQMAGINASAQTSQLESTLGAQVQLAGIDANRQMFSDQTDLMKTVVTEQSKVAIYNTTMMALMAAQK